MEISGSKACSRRDAENDRRDARATLFVSRQCNFC
jgi:hypothetical protein